MRVVLDTNVLISGLLWRGVPYRCLLAAEAEEYELVSAEPILDELHGKLTKKFDHTQEEADAVVTELRRLAALVTVTGKTGWVSDDPDDDTLSKRQSSATPTSSSRATGISSGSVRLRGSMFALRASSWNDWHSSHEG